MIGIVDYGMGNLGSVANACRYLNLKARIIEHPDNVGECTALVLPGQGAFADCMKNLNRVGFVNVLKEWIHLDKPILGICIGLQVLFEGSEEAPGVKGLGIFPGILKRFESSSTLKVPQMGWNRVKQHGQCSCWDQIPDNSYFYLVHSYYVPYSSSDWVSGTSEYGVTYTTVVRQRNLFATQFHPEKSQAHGLQLLRNFARVMDHQEVA